MRNVGSKAPGTGAKATAGKATPTQVADRTGAPAAPGTKIAPSTPPAPSTTAPAPAAPSPKGPTVEDVGTRVPEPAKLDTGERVQAPARPAAPKRSWLGLQAERMAVAEPRRREPAVLPPRRAPEPQVARALAQDATVAARPAPTAAVPRALVERHLKALLSKSEYSEARRDEWRTHPEEVRRDPEYVKAVLAADYKYATWVEGSPADAAALTAVLSDPAYVASLEWKALRVAHLTPSPVVADPVVGAALLDVIRGSPRSFPELPELYRLDPRFVDVALAWGYSVVKDIPLDRASASVRALVAERTAEYLSGNNDVAHVPEAARALPDVLERAVAKRPLLFAQLTAAERERVRGVFDDPALGAAASATFAARFTDLFGDKRTQAVFETVPPAVRKDDVYLATCALADPKVVGWAGLDGAALDALFDRTKLLADAVAWRVASLAPHLGPKSLARPEVRAKIVEVLARDTSYLERLPDALRLAPDILPTAIARSASGTARAVPIERLSPALRAQLEDALAKELAATRGEPDWSTVPAALRESETLARTLVTLRPSVVLPPALAAKLADVLADPAHVAASVPAWLKRLDQASWSKGEETYRLVPDAVRHHPDFARGLARKRTDAIAWAKSPEERAAFDGALRDLPFLATLGPQLIHIAKLVPDVVRDDPAFRAAVAQQLTTDASYFRELPETLRADPSCARAALASSSDHVGSIPLPPVGSALRAPVEAAWLEVVGQRHDLGPLPAELRGDASFLERLLVRAPGLHERLTPAELAAADAAFDDPKLWEKAGRSVFGLLAKAGPARALTEPVLNAVLAGVKAAPWDYRSLPPELMRHDQVVAATLAAEPKTVKVVPYDAVSPASQSALRGIAAQMIADYVRSWTELSPGLRSDVAFLDAQLRKKPSLISALSAEERALAAPTLADPALALGAGEDLAALLPHLPEAVLAHPEVKEHALAMVEANPGRFSALPAAYQREVRAVVARVAADKRIDKNLPPELLTPAVVRALIERSPALLFGLPAELLAAPERALAETRVIAELGPKSELSSIPDVLRTMAVQKKLLEGAGISAFRGWSTSALLLQPELWAGASRANVAEYVAQYPEQVGVVARFVAKDPELAALAMEKAREPAAQAAVRAVVDPALWSSAAFVDRLMALDPIHYQAASPELRADPERARRAILAHPANIDHAPISKAQLHEFLRAVSFPLSTYESAPWREEGMLEAVRTNNTYKTIDLRTPAFAAAALAVAPGRAASLPVAWLEDTAFLARALAAGPAAVSAWPLDRLSPEGRARITEHLEARAQADAALFEHLPEALRADGPLLASIVERRPRAILAAAGTVGPAVWDRAIALDATLFEKCPSRDAAVKDRAVRAATAQLTARTLAPKEVPEALYRASNDVAKAAMRGWGGHGLSWFSAWLKYPEVAQVAMEVIETRPEHAVEGLEKLSPELVSALASRLGHQGPPRPALLRFAIALADRMPALAEQLPPQLRDHPSVRSIAWSIDPPRGAVLRVATDEERVDIVRKRPSELEQLPPAQRSRELVLAAVSLEGELLRAAPRALADDRDVVLAAVTANGLALRHASERLRADPEIVARAIKTNPKAFAESKVTGPAARDIELLAVREGGLIDDRLERLKDQDFVLAFAAHVADQHYTGKVSFSDQSYRFAHHFEDPTFVEKLLAIRPSYLSEMPEKYWTPANVFTSAKKNAWFLTDAKGALDARQLPSKDWPALAQAHPRAFVRRFARDDADPKTLPALKAAVLEAIHVDEEAASAIPSAWWNDDTFVAQMVRANSFVLESFGPSRRRWLDELQPGATDRPTETLADLAKSGFTLKRFAGKFPLLEELLQNRYHPRPDDPRPVAVVVYPKADHNGAFDRPKFEQLTERYRVMYYEAGSAQDVAAALRDGTKSKPAEVVILAAHGSPESLTWGRPEQRPDQPYQLRPEHTTMLAELVPAERIAQDAKVIFDACAVGGGGKYRRNLVNCCAEVWPHVWLQAAWFNSSSGNKLVFHDDKTLDRMDFRDSETLRPVPYHVAAPTRHDYGPAAAAQARGIDGARK